MPGVDGDGLGPLLYATLFRRGDPQRFPTKTLRWRDMALDFAISIAPLIGGVVLSLHLALAGVKGFVRHALVMPRAGLV